jgi:hypothetical protein
MSITDRIDGLQRLLDGQHLPMRREVPLHLCDAEGVVQGYSSWPEFRELVFEAIDNLPALLEIARAAQETIAHQPAFMTDEVYRRRLRLRTALAKLVGPQ